jgi:hypothetical protein
MWRAPPPDDTGESVCAEILDRNTVWNINGEQLIARRKIFRINFEMNQAFEQREGSVLGQVDDWSAAGVPTGGDAAPSFAR